MYEGLTIHGDTIITGGKDWGDDGPIDPFHHIFQRESLGWTHNGVIVPTIPTEFEGYMGRDFDLAGNLFVVGTNTEACWIANTQNRSCFQKDQWQLASGCAS